MIDLVSRRLATLASTNAASAVNMATTTVSSLAATGGAALIGTSTGDTVQAELSRIATRGVFTVTGAAPGVDAAALIQAQVNACQNVGGGTVLLPRIGGAGYYVSTPIIVTGDNVTIEYDDNITLAKSTVTTNPPIAQPSDQSALAAIFIFSGNLWAATKTYLANPALIARRAGLVLNGNGAGISGFTYVVGAVGNHAPVLFIGTRNALLRNVYVTNGLVNCITLSYCPGARTEHCSASYAVWDNGIYSFGNAEHIVAFSDTDQTTWANITHVNARAWNCCNHGLGSYGSVGVIFITPHVSSCGNNTGSVPAGPAGGLGCELDPAHPERDYRFTAIGAVISNSWGFGFRTNCAGTYFRGRVENVRIPTAYVDSSPALWGGGVLVQNAARTSDIEVDVIGAGNYGVRLAGGDSASFTGAISGTTLTVSAVASGALGVGMDLGGPNVPPGLVITALGTGTGGAGTYTISRSITLAPSAMTAGYYPGGKFNIRAQNCLVSAVFGTGSGDVTISPASVFAWNGNPSVTTNSIYTASFSNAAANSNGGRVSLAGSFTENFVGVATIANIGHVNLSKGITGRNNYKAWAAANHGIEVQGTVSSLEAANILLDDVSGMQARILHVDAACARAIVDRGSIRGVQSNTNVPSAEFPGGVASYYGAGPSNTIFPGYASSYTPNPALQGVIAMGMLAGNITINAPGGQTVPSAVGDELDFQFIQDATGGRAVTWNAAWKAATLTGAGAASQKATVTFRWNGTDWVQTGSSGWFS